MQSCSWADGQRKRRKMSILCEWEWHAGEHSNSPLEGFFSPEKGPPSPVIRFLTSYHPRSPFISWGHPLPGLLYLSNTNFFWFNPSSSSYVYRIHGDQNPKSSQANTLKSDLLGKPKNSIMGFTLLNLEVWCLLVQMVPYDHTIAWKQFRSRLALWKPAILASEGPKSQILKKTRFRLYNHADWV